MNELVEYILENKSKTLDLLDWSFRNNFIEMFNLDTILLMAKLRPDIEKISIAYIYPEMLRNLQHLPNLKELHLEECVVIQEDWQEIVYLKKLESLSICRIEYIDKELFFYLSTLPNFLSLSIDECDYLSPKDLQNIYLIEDLNLLKLNNIRWSEYSFEIFENIAKIKNLNELIFLKKMSITDEFLVALLPLKKNLKKLSILFDEYDSDICISDQGIKTISEFKLLCFLQINNCQKITKSGYSFLINLPYLKTLKIKNCQVNDEILNLLNKLENLVELKITGLHATTKPFSFISKLTNLQTLAFNFSISSLQGIGVLSKLQALELNGCKESNILNFNELLSLKHLKYVDFSYSLVDSNALSFLLNLPNLETLFLENCNNITGEIHSSLIIQSNFKNISFKSCINMNDKFLESLSHILSLEKLNLSGCVKISDEGIHYLTKLKNLTHLSLKNCIYLTYNTLKFLTLIPSLRTINLENCNNLSEEYLKQLLLLPNLKEINLRGCDKISDNFLIKNINLVEWHKYSYKHFLKK
ncbi:MAG: hypothetical protein BGO10_04685 [Chlamydia sp. 32-24]|nr:MAG: hypothetical protein BGO10_04685 [Chlamydia sp. 32-24]